MARIFSIFTFISRRRPDTRFPVLPMPDAAWFFFGGVALVAVIYKLFDAPLLELARNKGTGANEFHELLTHVGRSNWLLWGSGIGMLALALRPAFSVNWRFQPVWHRTFFTLWFLFTSIAFSGLLTNLLKIIFGRSRPPVVTGDAVWQSDFFTAGYDHASFPSGHATTAGALTMALVLLFPRYIIPISATGLLIAMTRPVLGVHFPSDITAGFLFGVGFTWIWARSFARKQLLFRFDEKGRLTLRGEGKGRMRAIFDIALGRPGAKRTAGTGKNER